MNKSISVKCINYDIEPDAYDLLICVLGYEDRSTFIPKQIGHLAKYKIAFTFTNNLVHSYNSNKQYYINNGYELLEVNSNYYIECLFSKCIAFYKEIGGSNLKIAIDISSMTRTIIAKLLMLLKNLVGRGIALDIRFTYAPAKYIDPILEIGPITVSEPVIPEFAGWTLYPELPPTVIIGLGYEYDRAMGVIEYLEPSIVWAFSPRGQDRKYDATNDEVNSDLKEFLPKGNFLHYDVNNPVDCYIKLESLVYGLSQNSRPIIVPLGPKIFALTSMLVAMTYLPNITVWRVSGDTSETAIDRVAAGNIINSYIQLSENY